MSLPLAVEGLRITAERGRTLLAVDRLELPAGGALGIAGPSGAGKSTLLFALAGLTERTTGRIAWAGTDILALPPGARAAFRARHMGFVFQDFMLFDELSAAGNAAIAAGFRPAAERRSLRDRAGRLLSDLGLGGAAHRGRGDVTTYSGGERQRVALARALAGEPAIVLADEPTASLDRQSADRVVADLTGAARRRGTTLIAVSHDAALLSRMDRVLRLEEGGVARSAEAA